MKPINIFVKYRVNYKIDFFVSDSVDLYEDYRVLCSEPVATESRETAEKSKF